MKSKVLFSALCVFTLIVSFQNCGQSPFQARTPNSLESESLNSEMDQLESEDPSVDQTQDLATTSGKIYYVSKSGNDTTGLSKTTAFRTIQQAAIVARAGDTVFVLAGVYKEHVQNKNHGTASARIRFVSSPRWAAKIAPTKDAPAYWTSTGAYIDIEGFTLDGKLGGEIPSFRVRGIITGKAGRVMYNNIRLYRACTNALFYRTGIGIVGGGDYLSTSTTEIVGNIIRNTPVVGCSLIPRIDKDSNGTYHYEETAGYGIYAGTPKTKVYNNIITGFRIGIHLWHNPTENVVSHNLIFNCGNLRKGYEGQGIVFGCGDKPFTTCKNIVVANNILMHNRNIFAIRETGKNVTGSNQILNNILYMNSSNSIETNATPKVLGNLINVNPKLVNFQINGTGDYRLTAASPAVNKASTIGSVSKDINRGTRASGNADIGPYEHGASALFPIDVSTADAALVKEKF